jgi:hypothetical protein
VALTFSSAFDRISFVSKWFLSIYMKMGSIWRHRGGFQNNAQNQMLKVRIMQNPHKPLSLFNTDKKNQQKWKIKRKKKPRKFTIWFESILSFAFRSNIHNSNQLQFSFVF